MTFNQAVGQCLAGRRMRHPGMADGEYIASMRGIIMIYRRNARPHQHMPREWWARTDWEQVA